MNCATEDCPNEAKQGGRCWRCVKYRQRNGSFPSGEKRIYAGEMRTVAEAWRRYWEAPSDEEFERAKAATRMAMLRYWRKRLAKPTDEQCPPAG